MSEIQKLWIKLKVSGRKNGSLISHFKDELLDSYRSLEMWFHKAISLLNLVDQLLFGHD